MNKLYLIFDVKSGSYWRPEGYGYGNLQHAGIFLESETKRITCDRDKKAILIEDKKSEIEELFDNAVRLMRALR